MTSANYHMTGDVTSVRAYSRQNVPHYIQKSVGYTFARTYTTRSSIIRGVQCQRMGRSTQKLITYPRATFQVAVSLYGIKTSY